MVRAEVRELADHLANRRFAEALVAASEISGKSEADRRIACIVGVVASRQLGADREAVRFYSLLEERATSRHEFEGAQQVAEQLGSAMQSSSPELVRLVFERSAQQRTWIPAMGPIFAAVEAVASEPALGKIDPYDFRASSFSEWQAGLRALSLGQSRAADRHLMESVRRYEVGRLGGDATWSRFDLVLAAVSDGDLRLAWERARTLPAESTNSIGFKSLALEVTAAFADRNVDALDRWIEKFSGMREFQDEFYPKIAANLRALLCADREAFHFLLCKPAQAGDVEGLLKVAKAAELPSQPPSATSIHSMIDRASGTLAGTLPWRQGLLYLAASLHEFKDKQSEALCVGAGQIYLSLGGGWYVGDRDRVSASHHHRRVEQKFLVYRARPAGELAIELAGNCVLPRMRDRRVGRFITESRVLFLKIYGGRIAESCGGASLNDVFVVSNLLTEEVDGKYPFYEQIVRPLLGNMEYDEVDKLRYNSIPILDDFLGGPQPGQDGVMIPSHLLPQSIRNKLGEVRSQTIGAQRSLERFGFRRARKYDALDAGQYFFTTLGTLVNVVDTRDYVCLRVPREKLLDSDARYGIVAPTRREMLAFGCLKALVRQNDERPDVLEIEDAAANALGLNDNEAIALLKR